MNRSGPVPSTPERLHYHGSEGQQQRFRCFELQDGKKREYVVNGDVPANTGKNYFHARAGEGDAQIQNEPGGYLDSGGTERMDCSNHAGEAHRGNIEAGGGGGRGARGGLAVRAPLSRSPAGPRA